MTYIVIYIYIYNYVCTCVYYSMKQHDCSTTYTFPSTQAVPAPSYRETKRDHRPNESCREIHAVVRGFPRGGAEVMRHGETRNDHGEVEGDVVHWQHRLELVGRSMGEKG